MKQFSAKKSIILCVTAISLFLTFSLSFAQTSSVKKTAINLLSDDGQKTSIKFEMGDMIQKTVVTPLGSSVIIKTDKGTPILKKGYPDLPKLTSSVIIPDDKDMQVTVTSSHYTDYENVMVAPSKGTLVRDIDPSMVEYTYADAYGENTFFPKQLAELRDPYILRDYRGQTVIVYPFQYNAITKTLRVYSDITVSVSPKSSGTGINVFNRTNSSEKVSSEFNSLYANHFLNYIKDTRYETLEEEGSMLIISYGSFMNAMQPFMDWKIQKGMRTEMVDVATIGNDKTSIKNYVTDYYNTKGLTFLLLVGDDSQVNSSTTGAGDSDNDYGYLLGNDHYQEIFVGRFSAQTEADVITQVKRTLSYEKTPLIDSYYAQGVGIASDQGPGDDNEYDWEHESNLRTELVNYNYQEIYELYDGTHSGATNDENGNPSDDDLAAWVNSGIGIINYTGHGSTTSISTTGFNTSDVDNLTNTTKWPFLWIVGCVTGDFDNATCFAESWARATHADEPAGGLASMMSTINQYWDEPMEGQDEMNFILTESYENNIKRTFGGISINGCFSMNDAYGNSGYDMTDTWVCFGDPSVFLRTTLPQTMTVTHDPSMVIGSTQFTVACNSENALAALTVNGAIISTVKVYGGMATLSFDMLATQDTVTLTITGYNDVPYTAQIAVISPTGPYVIGTSFVVNDLNGNNNGVADFNENITLDVTLQNVGMDMAGNVTATIASTDPYITITDASESYGNIMDNAVSVQYGAFGFTAADNVPDSHNVLFTCTATDNSGNSWTSNFSIPVYAPLLSAQTFLIDDASGGNGDGYLDPGETAIITIYNANTGHCNATNATGTLISTDPYVTISNPVYSVGSIDIGANPIAVYDLTVAANAPYGIDVPFTYTVSSGAYSGVYNFSTVIAPALEDFETNNFMQFDWQLSGTTDWFTTLSNPYEGTYCSQSGDVGNNQSSTLQITLDVQFNDDISFAKKISSESGYDFLNFYIDGSLQDQWSGESEWTLNNYPVTTGTHTFKWTYTKDGYFSSGGDCGWLDNIMLPAFEVNSATAVNPNNEQSENVKAYPNPFDHLTMISYQLAQPSKVSIRILNELGEEIKTIINSEDQTAGSYQVAFDGAKFPSGNYFGELMIGNKKFIQKLVLSR